jgi:hypothetical protein
MEAATGVPTWGPERDFARTALTLGASGSKPTAVTARGFAGGAVNARA